MLFVFARCMKGWVGIAQITVPRPLDSACWLPVVASCIGALSAKQPSNGRPAVCKVPFLANFSQHVWLAGEAAFPCSFVACGEMPRTEVHFFYPLFAKSCSRQQVACMEGVSCHAETTLGTWIAR